MGHRISRTVIGEQQRAQKISLQGNRSTEEGSDHEDRGAQLLHINRRVAEAMAANQPMIWGGYEEKGVGGEIRERWAGVASEGQRQEIRCMTF